MPTTLTYGRKTLSNGDQGNTIYSALNANTVLDDAHTHNGVNSPLLSSSSISHTTQSILAVNWVSMGGGMYRQAVSITGGLAYDSTAIEFRNASGEKMFLHTVKIAASSYYVYINDNTLDITAIYT